MSCLFALWILAGIYLICGIEGSAPAPLNRQLQADESSDQESGLTRQSLPAAREFDSVWVRVQRGVNTECKTCPFPSCPNKDWYGSSFQFSAKCWTVGAIIGKTNLWLKTEEDCYVTEFDTIPYWRKYIDDLRRCETVQENVTRQYTTMTGGTPCRLCPNDKCDVVGNYSPSGKVTLTCFAQTVSNQCMNYCAKADPSGPDSYQNGQNRGQKMEWYKTINNCYVRSDFVRADARSLTSCGPVPYLKLEYRGTVKPAWQSSDGSFQAAMPSGPLDLPKRPSPGNGWSGQPRPSPSSTTTDADITFSLTAVSFATPPKDSIGWIDFTRAPGSPSQTLNPNDILNPPIGRTNPPKLSTSHLTLPSRPTPIPNVPHIISPSPFVLSPLILPPRPTRLSQSSPMTLQMSSLLLTSNLEKAKSEMLVPGTKTYSEPPEPFRPLILPPRPSRLQTSIKDGA